MNENVTLENLKLALDTSIRRNGGCVTFEQAWHVLNDVINFVHMEDMRIKEEKNMYALN
jgi:hypothetical protein